LLHYILSLCISLEDNQALHKVVNVQGSYDAVVGAGIYAAANYVPYDAIIDMIRMTKQGMILMLILYNRIIMEIFISELVYIQSLISSILVENCILQRKIGIY